MNLTARNLVLKKVLRITCLIDDPAETEYWSRQIAGIEKAINELASFKVKVDLFLFSAYVSCFR